MLSDPWVIFVQALQGVLLFVLPIHVFLFVKDRIPPYIKNAFAPSTAAHEEGAEVESRAILRKEQINRVGLSISNRASGFGVEKGVCKRVRKVEWVIIVDIAVDVLVEVVENVVLERVGWLHDNRVEVKPPKPAKTLWLVPFPNARLFRGGVPFSVRIFAHGIAHKVDLFPAFSPFVCISLLSAHVDNLKVVSPSVDVVALVPYAVPFNSPFSSALPFHYTTSNIGSKNNDKLVATSDPGDSTPPVDKC